MNFCSQCGAPVALRMPPGRSPAAVRLRGLRHASTTRTRGWSSAACPSTRAASCCAGARSSRAAATGRVPAGFMENGETLQQAAARESREEALAEVEIGSLLAIVHVLHAQQVHVFFRAALPTGELRRRRGEPGGRAGRPGGRSPGPISPSPARDFALRRYLEDRAGGPRRHHFTDHRAALSLSGARFAAGRSSIVASVRAQAPPWNS